MTSDKALKLGFLLTATDSMSDTLEKVGKNLTGFQKKMAGFGANAMRVGGHLTTMGNQIAGGMMNIVKAATSYGDASYKSAQKVGMHVEEWQKLNFAAKYAGVSTEKLESNMARFSKVLLDASNGTGEAAKVFNDLGIKTKDASGKLRAPQKVMTDLANVFASTKDSTEKTALSMVFFGKGGKDMIPLLNSGAKGLEEMGKQAEKMGYVWKEKLTKACEEFNDKTMQELSDSFEGFKMQIGLSLIPILTFFANVIKSVVGWLSEFIQNNRWVAKTIGVVVAGVGALLFGFGALALAIGSVSYIIAQLTKITKIYTATKKVCTFVVGIGQRVFGFLQVAISGARGATVAANAATRAYTVSQKAGVTTSLAYRIGQALSAAAQWVWNGAIIAGRAIMAFFASGIVLTGIKMGALAVWQGVATAAQWVFNASLYGCPIVWIIAGIMAVIAAVVLIVKYWDDIVAFFKDIWNGIIDAFSVAWDWFTSLPEKFAQFGRDLINGLINGILSAVTKLWETIKNIGKRIGGFFSKILGINSPSTVFAKYGMNITQGLVVGIDRGEGNVEHATEGMAMQAVNGYEQSIQVQTIPAGVAGNIGGAGGAFNYSPTINIGAGVSEDTKQDFAQLLREHYMEIVDIIQRSIENKARLSYT